MDGRHVIVLCTATTCAEVLRREGFRVTARAEAHDAFDAAAQAGVDAVVIHLETGHDANRRMALATRLQTDPTTRHLPVVIAITSRTSQEPAVAPHRFGAAVVVMTTAACAGIAAMLDEVLESRTSG
jgi:CheY-like chemotaxis protein